MTASTKLGRILLLLVLSVPVLSGCLLPPANFSSGDLKGEGLVFLSVVDDSKEDVTLFLTTLPLDDQGKKELKVEKAASDRFFRYPAPEKYSKIIAFRSHPGTFSIFSYKYMVTTGWQLIGPARYVEGYPSNLSFSVQANKVTYIGQLAITQSPFGIKATASDEHQRDVAELQNLLPNVATDQIVLSLMQSNEGMSK